jgi:radical SAM superfamily enzyme YgiQ (UPF0313 family)
MNVLLICPPATMGLPDLGKKYTFIQFFMSNLLKRYSRETVVGEHLGLEYLVSSLEQAGHHVTLLDACLMQYEGWQQVVDDLCQMDKVFGLVGFTGSQDVFLENLHVARALREAGWQGHFIAGHDFCSLNHEEIMRKFPVLDSIGRGEGEQLIIDLADVLERGGDLSEVDGLAYREDGAIRVNQPRTLIQDIDLIPFPDRRNWPYSQQAGLAMGIVSSRGCGYNRCTFCYPNVFTAANQPLPGGPWRARSAGNVVEELARISRDYAPHRITFVDENFLGCSDKGIERAYQIGHEILRRKLDVSYMINMRSVDVNLDLLKLLKESGLCSLFIGFESGSQKILDYYQKGATVSQQAKALEIIQELGVDLVVGYIFFDPISTIEDLRQSHDFYVRLNQYDVSKFSQSLRVLPGTIIYQRMSAEGTVFGDIWRTRYDFSSPKIDTVHALVRGLFLSLLPTLLDQVANDKPLSDRQAEQVIALMEDQFREALELADNGLEHDDQAVSAIISYWSSEILQCVNGR